MLTEMGLTRATRHILANPRPDYEEQEWEKKERKVAEDNSFCQELVERYMPTFCWMSIRELWEMLLLVSPELSFDVLASTVCRLRKRGRVLSKKSPYGIRSRNNPRGPKSRLYIRVVK